jgi:hypothetical protein
MTSNVFYEPHNKKSRKAKFGEYGGQGTGLAFISNDHETSCPEGNEKG